VSAPPTIMDDRSWAPLLRSYQKTGAEWLLGRVKSIKGRLLADAPGLGKTRTALASVRWLHENQWDGTSLCKTVFIFTTATAARDWKREANLFWPEVNAHILGSEPSYKRKSETDEAFEERANGNWKRMFTQASAQPSLLIADYSRADTILEHIESVDLFPEMTILDEAHNVKRSSTKRATMLKPITGRSTGVTLLTGTPVHNQPYDLHALLRMMTATGVSSSLYSWARKYFLIPEGERGFPGKISELLDPQALAADISHLVLARSPQEAFGGGLPAVQHHLKLIPAPGVARISPAKARALKTGSKLDEALRAAVRYKLEATADLAVDLGKPVVIFTYTREDAKKVVALLTQRKVEARLATGDLSPDARDKLMERWKEGDGTALVCTMDAVRESATLTRADVMIHTDYHWLPSVIEQNQGRIAPSRQKEGQRRPVNYYMMAVEGGPDEVIAEAIIEKLKNSTTLIGNKSALGDFLHSAKAGGEKGAKPVTMLSESDMLASLTERLNARAERLADLGLV
jgi:SNF2 family DNA or RNA helicase